MIFARCSGGGGRDGAGFIIDDGYMPGCVGAVEAIDIADEIVSFQLQEGPRLPCRSR